MKPRLPVISNHSSSGTYFDGTSISSDRTTSKLPYFSASLYFHMTTAGLSIFQPWSIVVWLIQEKTFSTSPRKKKASAKMWEP